MPVAPVADHVDDDVFVERLTEAEREARRPGAGLGVVTVDVEDRRLHHLGDVGRVHGAAGSLGRGGEAELVVDDDVDRAARAVARESGEVERLGDHALSSECSISVQQDRQDRERFARAVLEFGSAPPLAPKRVLAGTGHADHHRVDCFEVRRVRRHGQRDRLP